MAWPPRIQYFVESQDGAWLVRRDGKRYGPYADRTAAVRQAVDAAHTSGRNDRAAQVLVQGQDGTYQPEWTFGEDDYPPVRDEEPARALR